MNRSTPAYDTVIFGFDGTLLRDRLRQLGFDVRAEKIISSAHARFLDLVATRRSEQLGEPFDKLDNGLPSSAIAFQGARFRS